MSVELPGAAWRTKRCRDPSTRTSLSQAQGRARSGRQRDTVFNQTETLPFHGEICFFPERGDGKPIGICSRPMAVEPTSHTNVIYSPWMESAEKVPPIGFGW